MVEAALKTVLALVLAGLAAAYACGWRRLCTAGHAPPLWRLALYALGLVTIAAALLSPLDDLAAARFSIHMGQHLLLTMMAAPLLLLGNPLPLVLWGLPRRVRGPVAAPLRRRARLRAALSALTFLPVAGVLHVTTVWLWHLPFLYDAAVEHELVIQKWQMPEPHGDRKSTRLNSSHSQISYAVFCLKKKKKEMSRKRD